MIIKENKVSNFFKEHLLYLSSGIELLQNHLSWPINLLIMTEKCWKIN